MFSPLAFAVSCKSITHRWLWRSVKQCRLPPSVSLSLKAQVKAGGSKPVGRQVTKITRDYDNASSK